MRRWPVWTGRSRAMNIGILTSLSGSVSAIVMPPRSDENSSGSDSMWTIGL